MAHSLELVVLNIYATMGIFLDTNIIKRGSPVIKLGTDCIFSDAIKRIFVTPESPECKIKNILSLLKIQ